MITLIYGESGSGKSSSIRHLDPEKTLLIQTLKKPLPFKTNNWKPWNKDTETGSIVTCDNALVLSKVLEKAASWGKSIIVVDDFQYIMGNEFMRRYAEKGYDKFSEIAYNAWQLIETAMAIPAPTESDLGANIYFLSHSETNDAGFTYLKTIGKLLSEKIVLEGMFTTVLHAMVQDQTHLFATKSNGRDTVKSPIDLFNERLIPNDLAVVDKLINEFYA